MENVKKDWNDIKSNDSWSIFKIMSEFVEGFDRMAKIGPCVSIFGSARTKEENKYYQLTVEIAEKKEGRVEKYRSNSGRIEEIRGRKKWQQRL